MASLNRQVPPDIEGSPVRELLPFFGVARRARALGRRDLAKLARWLTMSVADLTAEWFESDLLRSAIAARAIFGHFAGPRSAGTGWLLLQRLAEDPIPVGSGMTYYLLLFDFLIQLHYLVCRWGDRGNSNPSAGGWKAPGWLLRPPP